MMDDRRQATLTADRQVPGGGGGGAGQPPQPHRRVTGPMGEVTVGLLG